MKEEIMAPDRAADDRLYEAAKADLRRNNRVWMSITGLMLALILATTSAWLLTVHARDQWQAAFSGSEQGSAIWEQKYNDLYEEYTAQVGVEPAAPDSQAVAEDISETVQGAPGAPGAQGIPGVPGIPGPAGANATAEMVAAAVAAYCAGGACTGAAGAGATGEQIAAAVAAYCAGGACVGARGTNGTNGTDGAAGANGADGAPGADGLAGVDGRGIVSITCVQPDPATPETAFRFLFSDQTTTDIPGTCTVPPETPAPTEVAP